MIFHKPLRIYLFLAAILTFCLPQNVFALGATIAQTGLWEGISSHQIIQAKIDGKSEQVCLPKIDFDDDIDERELKKRLHKEIEEQDAIFHLYHNGLGTPKKKGGMLYASDVYLKKLKMTYTGLLRKLGLKFKVSKTPAYEDKSHMRGVLYNKQHVAKIKEAEKAAKNKPPKSADKPKIDVTGMNVTTIYDVLPKGVIPPRIRRLQKEIDARIKRHKGRPYRAEIVKIDPVRWASGKFGNLAENGTITGSYLEGQNPDLKITIPKEKNWLTAEMISELKGQPCEFVLQLDTKGHEVRENNCHFLRDIYFKNLRLSWEEWLQKHGKSYVDPNTRADFAKTTIDMEVKLESGEFRGLRASVICAAKFEEGRKLVKSKELIRIFPPNPRPRKFVAFAKRFNQLYNGKPADFSILICPDGAPYTELGQKRARRIYFPEKKATMKMLQNQLLTGQVK